MTIALSRRTLSRASLMVAAALLGATGSARAENLNFSGTGTVRFLASDWADYLGGSSTFNSANDGGRLYWRGAAADGQYLHFDLSRLQGITLTSGASITLQNTNATYGGSVDNSNIATANGAWSAATGSGVPGATGIVDATNPTGSYGSNTSVTWGVGATALQDLVTNAATFNGFAIIGGPGSQMHFNGPLNPYLTVTTSSPMTDVVTVTGGGAWSNYAFADGVLTITGAVAGGQSGAGNVTINALGTVFVDNSSDYNHYWAVDSTRINTGGMLIIQGHSHLHNLTLAGGELAGIRGDASWGTWSFDDATTVTGGVVSTLSAQRINLDNGAFNIDAGATLKFSGSVRSGSFTPTIAAGGRFVNAAAPGTSLPLSGLALNGGELAATNTASGTYGHYDLLGNISVGGTTMSTISSDVRVGDNATRTFDVADVDGGSGTDLLLSGRIGHYNGVSGGSFAKEGAGTMRITGATEVNSATVNAGRLILEDNAVQGWWGGGLATNAVVEFALTGARTASYAISGSGSLTKSGNGTLTLSGNNTLGGGITINGGTLRATRNTLGTGGVVVNNGGTLQANDQWVFCGANGYGEAQRNVASLTLNAGGTLHLDATQGFANGITNFFINGGSVTGGANDDTRGALYLYGGNEQITAGGGVTSTIGVSFGLNGNNNSITVDSGSRLEMTNVLKRGDFGAAGRGGIVKNGAGTLLLSGANTFDGQVDINGGTLLAASNTALGAGGHAGETQSWIRDGATLALQGGISLDEHFHVWGAGVGGLGAVRSLSGDNALTNAPGGNAGYCLRSNTTVGVDAGTLTVSGFYEDGGSFGLTKVGNGTLVLNVLNSYTGGTTVNGGTLVLPGNGGNGRISGALTVNAGGTVSTTGDGTGFGYNNQLTSLTINGGLVSIGTSSSHIWNITGGITMTGGEMSGSTFQWNRTALTTNASANSAVISGGINLRNDWGYSSWDVSVADGAADSDLLVSASISGGGVALTKVGNGKMTLTGGNTYNGGTIINGGTVSITGPSADNGGYTSLGTGAVTINSGGILVSDGNWSTGNEWNNGNIGKMTINAGGNWTINTVANTLRNGLELNGGSITGSTENNDWGALYLRYTSVTAGGNATSSIGVDTAMSGATTFTVAAGSQLNFSGKLHNSAAPAAGGLTKSGDGTLSLSGNNTYTGTTTINAGTLKIGNGGASGSLYSPSAPSGNLSFGSGAAIVNNGALVYDIAGGAVHVNRTISGLGTVSVIGDQSVHFADGTTISTTGAQSYSASATGGRYRGFNLADNATVTLTSSGAISLTGMLGTANDHTGRLIINSSAGNGDVTLNTPVGVSGVDYGLAEITVNAGSGAITLGTHNGLNWSTLRSLSLTGGAINATANISDLGALTVTNSAAGTFSGTLSGAASLTKAGNGTLTLSGANTYAGTTTINGGTLVLDAGGTYAYVGGAIAINNGATLRVSGLAYTFNGKTIAFGAAGGGTLDAIATGAGGLYQTGDNTISTSGGAQNTLSGTRIGSQNQGINLNYQTLTFDVAAGTDPAVPNLHVTGTLWNGGNLTKSGNGILLLSGSNQYSGATTVNAGTLALGGSGSLNVSSSVTINGATASFAHRSSVAVSSAVNLVQGAVSGTGTINSLTVSDGASNKIAPGNAGVGTLTVGTLSFLGLAGIDFNSAGSNATNRLNVGTLDLTSATTVRLNVNGVAQGGWSTGTYDLIDYSSAVGSVGAIFQKGDITGTTMRTIAALKTDVAGKVSLVINSEIPKWTGLDGSEWKIGTTGGPGNWKLSTNAFTDYIQGDAVLFDDTASNKVVALSGQIAPTAVTFDNGQTYTLDADPNNYGFITGTTGLTKNGSGELLVLNLNNYTGSTVINAGKITLSADGQLGLAAPLVLAGGQLDPGLTEQTFGAVTITQAAASGDTIDLGALVAPSYAVSNPTGDVVIWADLKGTNSVFTKTGAGQVTLWGTNTYTGGTAINGGVLLVNGFLSADSAPLSLGGGQLDLGIRTQAVGAVTLTAAAGSGETIRNGSLTGTSYAVSNTSGNAIVSTNLRGTGIAFTKTGNGTLTLSGANTFSGAFTLNTGRVNVNAESALGGGSLIIAGGALGNTSGAAITLTANNPQSWNGDFSFAGASDLHLGNGAVTVSANRTIAVDGNTLSVGGSVSGGALTLTKTGAGTLNLMAGSALSGVTTVSGGTLVYGGAYASSTHAIASGATLELSVASGERDAATTTFSGAGTLRKTGNGRLIWGPGVATFALGSGSLIDVRNGTFTGGSYGNENWSSNLSSLNVEAGATFNTVEANVRVNRITGSGTIRTGYFGAGYANLTIGVDNGSSTFDGVIANADAPGNLVKIGTGAITLSGANTYTGTTTVSEGTLRAGANAAFTDKGRLVLANAGVFDLGGYNATFTTFDSTSANLITNSSTSTAASNANAVGTPSGAGVYVDAFTLSALDQPISAQLIDGATRKLQLVIANNNNSANLANITNAANSFSGGLVMTGTTGGTRLRLNSPLSGTPLGTGPIIIGQAATDKAQILFDSATAVTLANDLVVNTVLGTDNPGTLRVDTAGHLLTGKITANLAALQIANGGSIRLTGQITGARGLILERGITATLANTSGSANNYAGDTVINLGATDGRSATLRLGAANQIPTGAPAGNVTVSSSGTGIGLLDLNGFDQRINGLSGTGLVDGNAAGSAGANTLTVGDNNAASAFSGILRNTVGTLALTKTGNGLLSLEGDNTYDGATSVEAGILQVGLGGLGGRLGRGAVTIASGATLNINRNGNYVTTAGQTFAGAGTLVKDGSGDLTFWSTGPGQSLVSGLQNLTVNGGVVRTDSWAQWKSDLNLTVSGSGVFEMWNTTTSLGSLNGNGTVKNSANWSGYANGAAYATNNLTVASGNFSGTITDNGAGLGGNTGTDGDTRINLIKSGPGTLTLSAANTFGGTTTVNGGRLVVTHASALGAGAVTINAATLQIDAATPLGNDITVNNGGLLGGKGSTGSVAVATGGALAPGASPGILNTGNLTLARGSIIHWQVLDGLGNAGVGYDQLMVNGALDLTDASSSNRIILKISSINGQDQLANPLNFGAPNGVASIRTFQFGQAGGILLNNGVNISDVFAFDVTDFRYSDGSLSNAALWSIDWDGAGAITLTAVPEPSTYGLGLGALALAAAALRRRRRQDPKA